MRRQGSSKKIGECFCDWRRSKAKYRVGLTGAPGAGSLRKWEERISERRQVVGARREKVGG